MRPAGPLLLLLAGLLCSPLSAQGGPPGAYATLQACLAARALSADECRHAFRNAQAELDEKAPRFARRAECEAFFRRCMVGLAGGGRRDVYFMPQLREVGILSGAGGRAAVPVLYAAHPAIRFAPRPVGRSAEDVSRTRRLEAQARWARRAEPNEDRDDAAFESGADDEPLPTRPGQITSWPIPPDRRPKLIENP